MDRTDRAAYNAYMREYQKVYYAKRRADAIELLGGGCVGCGASDGLQFDHIDPKAKSFDLMKFPFRRKADFWAEIAKCQLLCGDCHANKSVAERGMRRWSPGEHGTVTAYGHCGPPKCEPCKAAKRAVPSYGHRRRSSLK